MQHDAERTKQDVAEAGMTMMDVWSDESTLALAGEIRLAMVNFANRLVDREFDAKVIASILVGMAVDLIVDGMNPDPPDSGCGDSCSGGCDA